MFYQVKLAHDLNLPARPKSMRFERIARVTPAELEIAKAYVLAEDTQEAMTASIEHLHLQRIKFGDLASDPYRT